MEEDTAGYSIELVVDFLGEGGRGLQSDCRTRYLKNRGSLEHRRVFWLEVQSLRFTIITSHLILVIRARSKPFFWTMPDSN